MGTKYNVYCSNISVIPQPVYMNSQQLFPQSTAVIDNDNGSTNSDSVENTQIPSIISNNIQSGRNCYFTDISMRYTDHRMMF